MSSFCRQAKHPETGKIEMAQFIDDYYGPHRYGVKFPDGSVFPEQEVEYLPKSHA